MTLLEQIDESVKHIERKISVVPEKAIVLGSGLGGLVDQMSNTVVIPYGDIPGYPKPTVEGHKGQMIIGNLDKTLILAMAGRFHYYEGHDMETVALPIRVLARLGIQKILITNAAGGVNMGFHAGDLMLITDHINFTGQNPLRGDNIEELGTRFPDMSTVYSPRIQAIAKEKAKENEIDLRQGVYAWLTGPTYETPAEIRMMRTLGADAVGMSTVPEAIVANHAKMEVLGISLITNMAAGVLNQPLSHEEVTETATLAAKKFETLVSAILEEM